MISKKKKKCVSLNEREKRDRETKTARRDVIHSGFKSVAGGSQNGKSERTKERTEFTVRREI